VPALERLRGLRVVAHPAALDSARWSGGRPHIGKPVGAVTVLRFSPDEAFAVGARDVDIDDENALVFDEAGFVGAWCDEEELWPHIEWAEPVAWPVLSQGSIAGVPAKLWQSPDDDAQLITAAPYAHELASRLGWDR
jgi:hypothetical protein